MKSTNGSCLSSPWSLSAALVAVTSVAARPAGPPRRRPVPGTSCTVFPADNVWNMDISELPVHRKSATWKKAMHSGSTDLHPDFGPPSYGIPFDVVDAGARRRHSGLHLRRRERSRALPVRARHHDRGRSGSSVIATRSWSTRTPARSTSCSRRGGTGGPHGGQRRDLRPGLQRPASRRLDQRRRRGAADPSRARPVRRGARPATIEHAIRVTADCTSRATTCGPPVTRRGAATDDARRWARGSA